MTTPATTIAALTDDYAVQVLALVLDHAHQLPDPARLRQLDTAVSHAATDPDLQPYHQPATPPPTPGDLARATLSYLAITRPDLAPVIAQATRIAGDTAETGTTRIDPATLAVGALVVTALQTEIQLERTTTGKWRFRLHKKATRDSALGQLLGKLIALCTGPTQK
jgi:hypothetical protein